MYRDLSQVNYLKSIIMSKKKKCMYGSWYGKDKKGTGI